MSIKYIAVISWTFVTGIEHIRTLHKKEEFAEIRFQSGYARLKDGTIYQVITSISQARQYEFVNYIKDPIWYSLEDEVKLRVK